MIYESKGLVTEAEYFAMEESAQVRYELYQGNLIEMAGGTKYHERIIKNLFSFLFNASIDSGYELFFAGMRLKINSQANYFYPDLMIAVAGSGNELHFEDALMVVEVLSPKTRKFDTVDKFLSYQNLPSLQYYLLVEPEYYHATLYFKEEDGTWQAETHRKLSEEIRLPKIGISVPFSEIYKGLEWD